MARDLRHRSHPADSAALFSTAAMNGARTQTRRLSSTKPFIRGHLGGLQKATEKGSTMTKDIYFIGSCAFIIAVMILVWSLDAVVPSSVNSASTSDQAPAVATEAAQIPTPSSNTPLPVQQWDA